MIFCSEEIPIRTVTGLRNVIFTLTGPAVRVKLVLVAEKLAEVWFANDTFGGAMAPNIIYGASSTITIYVHSVS